MTIKQTLEKIAQTSAETVVTEAIEAAKSSSDFNIFISIQEKEAIDRARLVDAGDVVGSLAGVPFAVKDNFLVANTITTAASNILSTFKSPITATAVNKIEAQGAILIGKVNLDAFAHGGSTENSAYGVTKNAHDTTRVAGGSSGGSAVAVAQEIVPFALGTDTGGSIRQPASFNGVVGFKPTYGAVSRYGVVSMASSTDTVGVLASNVEDTTLVMDLIAGQDSNDLTTLDDYSFRASRLSGGRIGVIKQGFESSVSSEVSSAVKSAIKGLESKGYTAEDVSMSMIKYSLAMYYIIGPAEISSNLARYDGVRYGVRSKDARTLDEVYRKSRASGFMDENKRRIMIGSYVLSSGFFDAYYEKAQKARTLLIQEYDKLFERYDALVSPVAPHPAFKIGDKTNDPITMYVEDAMTTPVSMAGLPAVSVPVKPTADGLPVGIQIIGALKSDAKVLSIAADVEEYING